jgi:hypothetical protein
MAKLPGFFLMSLNSNLSDLEPQKEQYLMTQSISDLLIFTYYFLAWKQL